jgi:hypothetical protein
MMQIGRYVDHLDVEGPMPPRVKETFEALRYEVTWLHAKWAIYSQLFCRGEQQLAFLDSMTPGFFVVVRDSFENELIVGLCRVTEGSMIGRRQNLTLARLAEDLRCVECEDLRGRFESELLKVDEVCSPLRKLRNRRLAHSDYPTSLSKAADSLPDVAWHDIDNALAQVRGLLNMVEVYFLGSEFHYESFVELDDGEELVFYLREARRWEEEEKRRALRGT